LKGILESRCLFASQIHFLNDTQEFKYSFDILKKLTPEFKDRLQKKRAIPVPPLDTEESLDLFYRTIERIYFEFDVLTRMPVCVFSFSPCGDLLSQWRGYCPSNGGYSIGFRPELLIPWLKSNKLLLEPCIYDKTKQEAIIREEIVKKGDDLIKKLSAEPDNLENIMQKVTINFVMEFSRIASKLKHPAFNEECEWRIISEPIENNRMSFGLRKSIFLPYLELSFANVEPFPIDEIIVGPALEQRLAHSSLQQFLLKKDLKQVAIKESTTPYRELM
jgi:hypothetical protein